MCHAPLDPTRHFAHLRRVIRFSGHHGRTSNGDLEVHRQDRTTMWGNPFVLGRDGNRRTVCQKFDAWLRTGNNFGVAEAIEGRRHKILEHVHMLRALDLVCGCWPLECHCLTLAELANKGRLDSPDCSVGTNSRLARCEPFLVCRLSTLNELH